MVDIGPQYAHVEKIQVIRVIFEFLKGLQVDF